jgi:glyoxylase-like metal-dependent hydrolase (beta-lactamase superfamily II)
MLSNDYLGNLASLGLTPEDIDVVLCTHLHTDHVGWNTRLSNGSWVPTFPNARYLMSELDVEYYGGLAADHPQYMFTREAYDDSVVPVLDSGQAELVATDHVVTGEVGNGVWMEGAPGHTPGSMLIHAQSGGAADKHAIFSGDVFHHPVQIQDPAVKMRREFIATYADEPAIVLAAHFPDPTAGRIIRHDRGATFAFLETM